MTDKNQSKSEALNDRKDTSADGSEQRGRNTSSRKINRRQVLGSIACSTVGLGVLSGTGAAQTALPGLEKTTLDTAESAKILGKLKRTEEFRRLRDYVADELDGKIRFDAARATVVKVRDVDAEGQGRTRYLAYSPIKVTSGDEAYVTMGIDAESEEVVVAGVEVVDKGTIAPEEYPIQFDDVEGETATVPMEIDLIDATGEKLTTATITNEDFDRFSNGAESSDNGVSIQSTYTCDLCKTAVSAICVAGCGAPVWFLCGLIGVGSGGIGGFACGAFIAVVCTLIAVYGCTTSGVDRKICSDRRVGLC